MIDTFPAPTEHSMKFRVVELGETAVRCFLTGCVLCDQSGVFIEKIEDNDKKKQLALRRILTPTETVTVTFRGLEDIDLKKAVENNTLTHLVLNELTSYHGHKKCTDTEHTEVSDFACTMNFLLSLSKDTVRDRLLAR